MGKIIRYQMHTGTNHGTSENPQWEDHFFEVTMGWNEANEAIAAMESYNGEYCIEDDGAEETHILTMNERLRCIEQYINKLKSLFPNLQLG